MINSLGISRLARIGGWVARLGQCGGRGMLWRKVIGPHLDMPYVHGTEKYVYQEQLSRLVEDMLANLTRLSHQVSLDQCVLCYPSDELWCSDSYFCKTLHMETRFRTASFIPKGRTPAPCIFGCWHNQEVWGVISHASSSITNYGSGHRPYFRRQWHSNKLKVSARCPNQHISQSG